MSLALNTLKIRKAFSDPEVPHSPSYSIADFDLEGETGLSVSEIREVLVELEKEGVIRVERYENFPTFVVVNEEFRELMGVSKEAEEAKRQAVVAEAKSKLTPEEKKALGVSVS